MKTLGKLLILFTVVPLVELAILIWLSDYITLFGSLALVVGTGLLGAWLARRQGLSVLRQIRAELAGGQIPAGTVVDGVLILLAAALLITPGVLTDVVAVFCLAPGGRSLVKRYLRRRFETMLRTRQVRIVTPFHRWQGPAETPPHGPSPEKRLPEP
ncbi:MAG: FxsA family protein [Planctomycetaceae bacterium]